jgi:hypothetical protein
MMLIRLLHALLSPFFIFCKSILNLVIFIELAILFFLNLFFASKLSNLNYHSLYVLFSLLGLNFLTLQH